MFVVIYKFEVKENMNSEFLKAWEELTDLIYEYEGSLGSRVHFERENVYVAYAQWPDKGTWENAGSNMPENAEEVRSRMRNSCAKIETLYELECVKDLLRPKSKNIL